MYSLTIEGLKEARQLLGDLPVDKALRSTKNKLAAKAKTAVSKSIRQTYNISAKDLSVRMRVEKARLIRDPALLVIGGRRLSLILFGAEETVLRGSDAILSKRSTGKNATGGLVSRKVRSGRRRRGVTVRVRKDRGKKFVKGRHGYGGFIAQGRSGKLGGGFARRLFNAASGKVGRGNIQLFERKENGRLPIDKLTGPSPAQMANGKTGAVAKLVNAEAGRIFNNEMNFFVNRLIKKNLVLT
jgi:hypothetical protein